jgi:hypothetical protein
MCLRPHHLKSIVLFFYYLVNFFCIHTLSSVLNVAIIKNIWNMRVGYCPVTVLQWRNQFLRSVWCFLLSLLSGCGSGWLFWMVVISWFVWSWKVSNSVEYVFCNVSETSGSCRSVCSVSFLTYQGASVIMWSILFCNICILLMLVLDAEPQMELPYVQIDLIIVVYKSFLIFSGVCERSKYKSNVILIITDSIII